MWEERAWIFIYKDSRLKCHILHQRYYYKLNHIPWNSHVEAPMFHVTVFRDKDFVEWVKWGHKSRTLMLQLVSLTRTGGDTRVSSFPPCTCAMEKPCEDTARNLQARKRGFTRNWIIWHCDLGPSSISELWEIHFRCISHLVYGISLWQPKQVHTGTNFLSAQYIEGITCAT